MGVSVASGIIILYILERLSFISGGSKGVKTSQDLRIGNVDFLDLKVAGHPFDRNTGLMVLVIVMTIAVFGYIRNVTRSPLARSMKTVNQDCIAAQTFAISPTKTILSAHFICGLCAGIAGALFAPLLNTFEITSTNPWLGYFGIFASMQILAFVVVGGMKKYWLTVAVVFVLAFLSVFLQESSSSISWLSIFKNSRISPIQVAAILSSILVIATIHLKAQIAKKQL